MIRRLRFLGCTLATAAVFVVVSGAATPAFAGPPLLCFPFDIGAAKSLPMGAGGWQSVDPAYDPSRLVADTIALLTPQTSIIVRMETLRRATVYAAKNPKVSVALLDALQTRAARSDANAGLAVFDFGYLAETYKQASFIRGASMDAKNIDGYMLVQKAQTLTGDKAMAFALVAMSVDKSHGAASLRAHVAEAREAAKTDAAVRANLANHWPETTGQF